MRQPDNLALQKLKKAQPLTQSDLDSLQQLLISSGAAEPANLERATENAHGFGRFIRSLVGMDRHAAATAFAHFLDGRAATANQIQFLQLIVDRFTRDGTMAPAMLFEPPFTNNAPRGVTSLFDNDEARRIVAVIDQLNHSADAS